jgi:cytosine/uracil/thiamine/allantoin permease
LSDQENFYLNSEDYTRFARQTNEKEQAVVQRMGLKM